MELKEHLGNQYEKQVSSVERYLLRIIKRYFDLEALNNAASINAIITEAMARYKASIDYKMAEVLKVNNKVGITNITLQDLKGEMMFEELTAFNKDFGTTQGTICEGNDQRLSDDRKPNNHHHKIISIKNLREQIDNSIKEMVLYSKHLHTNKALLDKIQYSGTRLIDLKELDTLGSIITTLLHDLSIESAKLEDTLNIENDAINKIFKEVYLFIQRLKNTINDYNLELEKELKKNIDDKLNLSLNTIKETIETYTSKKHSNLLIDVLNNSKLFIDTQEIVIKDILNITNPGESLSDIYNLSAYGFTDTGVTTYINPIKETLWAYDSNENTLKGITHSEEYLVLLSSNKYKYYSHEMVIKSNEVDVGTIAVIIAADDNMNTLSLCVTAENTGEYNKFSVIHNYNYGLQLEVAYDDSFTSLDGWNNNPNGIYVKIERENDIINIYRSEMNAPNAINKNPCITINLAMDEFTKDFVSPCKYGYGYLSQKNAIFNNVVFESINEVVINENIYKEENINMSVLSSEYITDTMEIESKISYKDTKIALPYITNNFSVECGKTFDDKFFIRISPYKDALGSGIEIPIEILNSKIINRVYAKRKTIPYLV